MSSHLSRWRYTCIHQWREMAFHPDWNEPNWVVIVPMILKVGKEVSWTFFFDIPHRLLELRQWFGEDHLLCFFQDVLSHVGMHVPFFYTIRYSHWLLLLLPVESHSCFWQVPCQRNEVFLIWAYQQYRVCHSRISLYPSSLFGTYFLSVWWQSMKKAACLPLEHIAHFGSAMKPVGWHDAVSNNCSITLYFEVFPIGELSLWGLS